MKKVIAYTAIAILSFTPAYSYTDPINVSGITGYIFTPSAYIQPEKSITAGATITDGFKNIFLSSVPFPGLEAGISYDFEDSDNKNLHIKYQFLPETEALPAIAFGTDINSDSTLHGNYVVVSKYFDIPVPQTITIGYGSDFYNGFFAGSELLIHPKLTFVTEYIEPDRKDLNALNIKPVIHTNFSLKVMPISNLQIILYYNFGREAGVNLNCSIKF
ncbi:YjbH domain-containing protein [Desulfurobacterium sp.]|uniref:YjbH domain-containing protein n=1 Tax=Desulfurobacterium sp. TaxID=2004706 RepID=UPI0026076B4B|nr:YjbH domain-containing protein [Desulfurobacterium sp.]